MDREKLIKLLNLTASKNDAEALTAIRKVNLEIGEKSWKDIISMSWDELIFQPVKDDQKNPDAFSFKQTLRKKYR
jgi:hypothetical protein